MSATGLGLLVGDFTVTEKTVAVGVANTKLCNPDPTRWALILSNSNTTGNFVVSTRSPVALGTGILVPLADPRFAMNFRDFGALVNLPWFAIGDTPGTAMIVTEILYRPSSPTLDMDDLIRELKRFQEHALLSHPRLSRQLWELRQQLSSVPVTGAEK